MLSVVIPCYNEAAVLPCLGERLRRAAIDWPTDWEVLLVDDGSSDQTWPMIQDLHWTDGRFKGVSLARNFGQQAAIGAGLDLAQGDAVVLLDADLQDPPELVARMLSLWHQGYDVVYGIRTDRQEAWWKRWSYALFYRIMGHVTAAKLPADAGDFCLMDRKVVAALRACREQQPFWRGLRAWTGFRQHGLHYRRPPRQAGCAQYTWRKLVGLATDGLYCLAPNPLRSLTLAGALALVCSLGLGPWLSLTNLAWAVFVLGSVQLLATGLIGELLSRIYNEVRRRPRWIIADVIGIECSRIRQNSGLGTREATRSGDSLLDPNSGEFGYSEALR